MIKLLRLLFIPCLLCTIGCSHFHKDSRIHNSIEKTLLRAGFKRVLVTTTQQQQFQKLPAGKITQIKSQGKNYFLYPDFPHHCLFVGRNRQFMQYNQLVANQLYPHHKSNYSLERYWHESGLLNMGEWKSVGWDDPFFLAY